MLAQIQEKYPEDVRIVYRHFPLNIHDKANLSTQASEAAGAQGKFWEMHDLLFEKQADWSGLSVEEFQTWLNDRAADLELDADKFKSDLTSEAIVKLAEEAYASGAEIGLPGTPFLMFNGLPMQTALSFEAIDSTVQAFLLEKRQFQACPPMIIDPAKQYTATMKTDKGDIVIELYADKAPLAVNSFVFLAQQGWFDNVTFHRVLPGFVAQGGDPSGSGMGGPGYEFDNEISPDLKFDSEGIVAMANAGANTNGSQFFITYAPTSNLDGGYTIFGRVIAGMEVAKALTPRDPSQGGSLPPGDKILDVVIEEK